MKTKILFESSLKSLEYVKMARAGVMAISERNVVYVLFLT
jgi:hypothetical protein